MLRSQIRSSQRGGGKQMVGQGAGNLSKIWRGQLERFHRSISQSVSVFEIYTPAISRSYLTYHLLYGLNWIRKFGNCPADLIDSMTVTTSNGWQSQGGCRAEGPFVLLDAVKTVVCFHRINAVHRKDIITNGPQDYF